MPFIDTPRAGCKKVALVSLITLLFSFAVAGIVGMTKTRSNRIVSNSAAASLLGAKAPKAGGYYEFVGNDNDCADSQGRAYSFVEYYDMWGWFSQPTDPYRVDFCAWTCDRCVKGSLVPKEAFRGYTFFFGCQCLFDLPLLEDNPDLSTSHCGPTITMLLNTDNYGTGPMPMAGDAGPEPCYRWVSG